MTTQLSRVVAVLALIVIVRMGVAQCAAWSAMDGGSLIATQVLAAITWDPDGPGPSPEVLVVGGAFEPGWGGIPAHFVATWNGVSWQSLGAGPDGPVHALGVYNGELIAGGYMSSFIARWDGSSWTSLGAGMNNVVTALIDYNGELVAGGQFTMAGGIAASGVARWNGSVWQPLGSGLPASFPTVVTCLGTYNGELIAGGYFNGTFGGVYCQNIARWDGSSWHALSSGLTGNHASLETYNGELYAGGDISEAGGVPVSGIARWNGSLWQAVGGGMSSSVHVWALQQYRGDLVAGGDFAAAGGVACNGVAHWNGSIWQPFGSGLVIPHSGRFVSSLATYDGALIAGGYGLQPPETPPGTWNMVAMWSTPLTLDFAQPGGAGTGVLVTNTGLIPGHEYYNVASYEICGGGPGAGPYGGLCFSDLSFLYYQLSFPVGFHPFHFLAGGPTIVVGPYYSSPWTLDAVCADVTGGTLGCISDVIRFTIE